MLNFTSIHPTQHIPTTVNVNEKKAPTDESIRILSEMEKAAENKLVSITRLKDNLFDATWHVFDEPASCSTKIICRFSMNGQTNQFTVTLEGPRYMSGEEIVKKVHETITAELGKIFTLSLFQSAECSQLRIK